AAPADPADRRQHADNPAVEAHPPFPQLEDVGRAPQFGLVEGRIAEPTADNDAQRAGEEEVVDMALRHGGAGRMDHLRHMPPSQHDAAQISERIIAEHEAPEIYTRPEAEIFPVDRLRCNGR